MIFQLSSIGLPPFAQLLAVLHGLPADCFAPSTLSCFTDDVVAAGAAVVVVAVALAVAVAAVVRCTAAGVLTFTSSIPQARPAMAAPDTQSDPSPCSSLLWRTLLAGGFLVTPSQQGMPFSRRARPCLWLFGPAKTPEGH